MIFNELATNNKERRKNFFHGRIRQVLLLSQKIRVIFDDPYFKD
jgi:hypothetical protein